MLKFHELFLWQFLFLNKNLKHVVEYYTIQYICFQTKNFAEGVSEQRRCDSGGADDADAGSLRCSMTAFFITLAKHLARVRIYTLKLPFKVAIVHRLYKQIVIGAVEHMQHLQRGYLQLDRTISALTRPDRSPRVVQEVIVGVDGVQIKAAYAHCGPLLMACTSDQGSLLRRDDPHRTVNVCDGM
jgi:hypothetical protein